MERVGHSRAAAVLCAAIALGAVLPGASASAGGAPGPTSGEVDAAMAFRSKLGFRSDRAYVGSTFGRAGFSKTTWGVPLDSAETAEVERRANVQKATSKAFAAWAREAGSAGAYIDQRAGGAAVFLTTGDPVRARREMADKLPSGPAGASARFVRVRYSTDELLALQGRIDADLEAGALAGLGISSTSIDARANSVRLGVASATAEVRAALVARYGDGVAVAFEPPAAGGDAGDGCVSRKDCLPAKGGIEIRSSYNGNNCTIGFLVQVVGSGESRLLTAGHCVVKSGGTGTSRKWREDNVDVGWAEFAYWTDGADADVALINPSDGAVDGDRNLVYRASNDDLAPIIGWQASAAQVQGGLVCRAGVASGYHCGTIALTNRTRDVDGNRIDHQWVVDFDACPGDSGGPYVLDGTAYGIHTDSTYGCDPTTNLAWYSPMGYVLEVLASRGHPVELCTTATCGAETNVWTPRGPLGAEVSDSRLVALGDGRVLRVGGFAGDPLAPDGGGPGAPAPEIFDPVTGLWTPTSPPPWAPAECEGQFAVGLDDGRVLVGGGRRADAGDPDACSGAALFDPLAPSEAPWLPVASPPVSLVSAAAALLADGRAFVTGGSGPTGATSVAMAWSPATGDWANLAPAPAGALAPIALRLGDGRVLVSGGYVIPDGGAGAPDDVAATQLYDPETDSWSTTNPVGAYGLAGTVLRSGRVVLAGGRRLGADATFLSTVSRFDPSTGSWTQLPTLPTARSGFTFAELPNGLLLAAGGRIAGGSSDGAPSSTADAFEPVSGTWHRAPSLDGARSEQASAILEDGSILVAGGGTDSTETYVEGDLLPPVGSTPSVGLRGGARMTVNFIPIRVTWPAASDTGGSGAGTYDVERSTDGGPYQAVAAKVPTTTFATTVATGHTYRFRIRPRDWAGNAGAWKAGAVVRLGVVQQAAGSVAWSGAWKTLESGSYSGGSTRSTTQRGASATFTFTGRGVAIVSTRGTTLGAASVYIDGSYAGKIRLNASSRTYRYVAFQRTWSSMGTHRIRIVAAGTWGHPRVDVDAFVVLSNP